MLCRRGFLSASRQVLSATMLSSGAAGSLCAGTGAALAASPARGRVQIRQNGVRTDRNTVLRGACLMIGGAYWRSTINSQNMAYWKAAHDLGLNALRLDVKLSDAGRNISQQLPLIDKAVDLAQQNNMYIMILNSVQPGRYNLGELKTFWGVVAERYRNRTHVIYEMTNEPVAWWPHDYSAKAMNDLKSVYNIMRTRAPATHIVLFTFPNFIPDSGTSIVAKIAMMSGIDYTKTSVGFHHYCGGKSYNAAVYEATVRYVRNYYPVLMTETSYWLEAENLVVKDGLQSDERLGIGWFSLDGKDSLTRLTNEILPRLHRAGFNWPVEY